MNTRSKDYNLHSLVASWLDLYTHSWRWLDSIVDCSYDDDKALPNYILSVPFIL